MCMRTCVFFKGMYILCMRGCMCYLLAYVHRNALWCTQKRMNVLCTMCKYMCKHMCTTHMYMQRVCICVAYMQTSL